MVLPNLKARNCTMANYRVKAVSGGFLHLKSISDLQRRTAMITISNNCEDSIYFYIHNTKNGVLAHREQLINVRSN